MIEAVNDGGVVVPNYTLAENGAVDPRSVCTSKSGLIRNHNETPCSGPASGGAFDATRSSSCRQYSSEHLYDGCFIAINMLRVAAISMLSLRGLGARFPLPHFQPCDGRVAGGSF